MSRTRWRKIYPEVFEEKTNQYHSNPILQWKTPKKIVYQRRATLRLLNKYQSKSSLYQEFQFGDRNMNCIIGGENSNITIIGNVVIDCQQSVNSSNFYSIGELSSILPISRTNSSQFYKKCNKNSNIGIFDKKYVKIKSQSNSDQPLAYKMGNESFFNIITMFIWKIEFIYAMIDPIVGIQFRLTSSWCTLVNANRPIIILNKGKYSKSILKSSS